MAEASASPRFLCPSPGFSLITPVGGRPGGGHPVGGRPGGGRPCGGRPCGGRRGG